MRRRGSKSKSVVSDTTDTDSSATESDSSATKTDDRRLKRRHFVPVLRFLPIREGEKVIAFHNHRLYAAKVTNIRYKMEWEFYVHYLGWSKNWDEWVGVDRLMKNTEENRKKQEAIKQKQGTDKNAKLKLMLPNP